MIDAEISGPVVRFDDGNVERVLPEVLHGLGARRVLVVATAGTLRRTGARRWFAGHRAAYFSDVAPNPQLAAVLRGTHLVAGYRPDVVVGIGGGSVLDTAKSVRLLPEDAEQAAEVLTGRRPPPTSSPPRLVLVPTTAGPGSEVTGFATVYLGTRKYSLDHRLVSADVAIVDPSLTRSCPPRLSAHCAFDAVAHAIESFWSPRATGRSRTFSMEALRRLLPVLRHGFGRLTPEHRSEVSTAAVLAGQAIDITRTTAAHAFAYPTTAFFGVPHGLACALHLTWLLPLTLERLLADGAGSGHATAGALLTSLDVGTPEDAGQLFVELLARAGCPTRLGACEVRPGDLDRVVTEASANARASNHPVPLDRESVLVALRARL